MPDLCFKPPRDDRPITSVDDDGDDDGYVFVDGGDDVAGAGGSVVDGGDDDVGGGDVVLRRGAVFDGAALPCRRTSPSPRGPVCSWRPFSPLGPSPAAP